MQDTKILDDLHPEDEGSEVLQNSAVLPYHYMTSQPRKPLSGLPELVLINRSKIPHCIIFIVFLKHRRLVPGLNNKISLLEKCFLKTNFSTLKKWSKFS
jgi:hypothetical protein